MRVTSYHSSTAHPHLVLMALKFASYAWLLKGIGNTPGWLCLREGRLAFVTVAGVVFDVPRAELSRITCPWYYFSGGMKLNAAGQRYRIAFVLPNDAEYPVGQPVDTWDGFAALTVEGAGIQEGRKTGRRWRELLGNNRVSGERD